MDTTSTETVKICPTCDSSAMWAALANQNSQSSPAEMMAMLNNNANNAWQNSPFAYIMFMMLFRMFGNGWGTGADAAQTTAENFNSRQIAALQDTVNTNHNNDLVMQALSNNQDAIRELAQTFNTDLSNIQQACCNINASIQQVAGQIGYSAESVKNAIALGDSNIMSKMQDCCCQTKTAILDSNYQNQLATERQTGILGSKIDAFQSANQLGQFQLQSALGNQINDTRNAMVNGFAQVGYATQAQTNEIVQASNANTQRILDAMCNQSTQALRDQLADKDRELQTANIINQLKASGCNCGA